MASISALSGTQSASQAGVQQLRLQQAKQDAERAEQAARALQGQARDAQQRASQAQRNARSIASQADQAEANAGQARRGVSIVAAAGQMQASLAGTVGRVVETLQTRSSSPAGAAVASAPTAAPAVVNAEGQVTGTVINTSA